MRPKPSGPQNDFGGQGCFPPAGPPESIGGFAGGTPGFVCCRENHTPFIESFIDPLRFSATTFCPYKLDAA